MYQFLVLWRWHYVAPSGIAFRAACGEAAFLPLAKPGAVCRGQARRNAMHTLERYGSGCCDGIQFSTGRVFPSRFFYSFFLFFRARAHYARGSILPFFRLTLPFFRFVSLFSGVIHSLPRNKSGRIGVFSRVTFTVDLPERREIWDKFQHRRSTAQRAIKLAILTVQPVSAG